MLKKFIPKTLQARFLLIIILPIIFAQMVATYIFYERHWESVTNHMEASLVDEISVISELMNIPDSEVNLTSKRRILSRLKTRVQIIPMETKLRFKHYHDFDLLKADLQRVIIYPFYLVPSKITSDIELWIEREKDYVKITFSSKRISNPTADIFILWMFGATFIFLIISLVFTKNQLRSIKNLAEAAEKFGKGEDVKFKPEGALEIRRAGTLFLQMKQRIERQIKQRTEMLAGVSHDLKTPLTRMKLEITMMNQNDSTIELLKDVDDMEKMINDYLVFARDESQPEVSNVNIDKFIKNIIDNFANSKLKISSKLGAKCKINIREISLKRAIRNIIDNSVKYAKNLHIETIKTKDEVIITLEDDGPGVSPKEYQNIFKPFYRIDPARNLNSASVGLGMAITKDAILKHGGKISLDHSKMGGLKVVIGLPV